jgi:hypothetical protein
LTLDESLKGFTSGPAYLASMENKVGRLMPGFLADLIVLDQDPFELNPHDLQHVHPTANMLGGEWVWKQ